MAHYARKDSDLQATEKILRKIMSTGRDTGRFSDKPGRSSVPFRSSPNRKSHPPSRKSEVGGKSTPGATLLQMNLNTADPNEAMLKRTHDGVNRVCLAHSGHILDYALTVTMEGALPLSYRPFLIMDSSPACTVHTGQSYASKKRAVANGSTPTKSPGLLSRGDKHLTGVPVEKKILDLDSQERWNTSYQALRLEKEWIELHDRRSMKRNSEILRHRVDKMYMMSGSGIKLKAKYEISEDELQQLKDLSEARRVLREKSQKTHPIPKAPKVSLDHGYFKNSKDKDGQQEIRIQGEGQGSVGTPQRGESVADNVRNPHTAEWASEADAHQHPAPQSEKSEDGKPGGTFLTEGNHGNTSEINGNNGDTVEAEGNHGDAGETEGNHGDAADTEGNHGNTSEINGNHGDTVEAEGNHGDAETEGNHGDAADTEGNNCDNANLERESNHDETGNTDESQNNTSAGVKTETQEVDQSEAQSGQEVADQEEAGGQSGDRQAVDDGEDGVVEGEREDVDEGDELKDSKENAGMVLQEEENQVTDS